MFTKQTISNTKTTAPPKPTPVDASFAEASHEQNSLWQSLAFGSVKLQPKLSISQPDDPYEQEADRVADQVMRTADPYADQSEPSTSSAGGDNLQRQFADRALPLLQTSAPVIQRDPDKKQVAATVDNVDDLYGPLTEDLAKQAFSAYGGALVGNEQALISAFKAEGFSGWMGLAIIKQESSFANKANNSDIDERNVANPFSVHFNTSLKGWPKGCGKNLLLIAEAGKNYTPSKDVKKECAAKDFRLPTFTESATASAKTMGKLAKKKEGIDAYREAPGYKKDLNGMLNDILNKIKAKRK
ncbi:MAG TPA: hypothetical protein VGO56_10570 [Pyrinomonadaceae bacterium]|jgi:hypothetical protein|nr:hypothetical protein [Pyrinomonadaceae bacterium]